MPNIVKTSDDYPHTPEKKADWRESYYFNFVNHDKKASGFTTIGILPNQQKAEFVLALFHEDKQTLYYKEQHIPKDNQVSTVLSNKTLTYKLIEPMRKWEINLINENLNLQVQWEARFSPFDFGKCSGTSWKGHFEQSGIVKGEARLPNEGKVQISGYSQRDKSWGPRDWHIKNWFALHAQFKDYAIGLRRDTVNNRSIVSGGLSSCKQQTLALQVNVKIEHEKNDPQIPTGALTTLHFADGKVATLQSKLISPKSFTKFSRTFPKGSTELFEGMAIHEFTDTGEKGTGLIEFLFTQLKP